MNTKRKWKIIDYCSEDHKSNNVRNKKKVQFQGKNERMKSMGRCTKERTIVHLIQ